MDKTKYGLVLPGGSLVATDQVIANDPNMLGKFVRAANKGMEAAAQDPLDAAHRMLKHWQTTLKPEIVAAQIKAVADATSKIQGKPLGYMEQAPLKDALEGLKEAKLVDEIKPIGSYYTNDILLGAPTN